LNDEYIVEPRQINSQTQKQKRPDFNIRALG
jgi:hypothetical protein